jgi:hypothetical protein
MRQIVITACAALVTVFAFLFPASAARLDPQDTVPQHINDLPLYGNVKKSQDLLDADAKFKAGAIAAAGSAEKASQALAARAWREFQSQKLNVAMRRANEAWLLDDKNYRAYWLMALVQHFRGAPRDEVDGLFKRAFATVTETDRPRLERDYNTFKSGHDDMAVENQQEIAQQYQKATQALTSK